MSIEFGKLPVGAEFRACDDNCRWKKIANTIKCSTLLNAITHDKTGKPYYSEEYFRFFHEDEQVCPIETRNIIDHYHYWDTEAIKADLDTRRHPFGVLVSNLANDFNVGTVIRSANAFLAREVFFYGRRRYDRRGTVGTHHYENLKVIGDNDLESLAAQYTLVAIDNVTGAEPIETFKWPANPLLMFGQEQVGLPQTLLDKTEIRVYIKQYGSVRSLNVGSAASIAMYDWCVKNVKKES